MTDPGAAHWTNFRDIPLDVLRDFVRTRAEATSIRQIADELGIGGTTLHSFINSESTTPHPRIRRKSPCALWTGCTRRQIWRWFGPYAAALDVLVGGMPERQRGGAVEIVLDGLEWGRSARMSRRRALGGSAALRDPVEAG